MKFTLTINGRGDVTLPAQIRDAMGLKAHDALVAEITPRGILLRPVVCVPIEIYTPRRLREFDEAEQELAKPLSKQKPTGAR